MEEWLLDDNAPAIRVDNMTYDHAPEDTQERRFTNCKFLKISLVGLQGCSFTDCEFQDCTLARSINRVMFSNCDHIRSDFSDTQLARVMFVNGKMIRVSFSRNTVFNDVTLSSVRGLDTSRRLYDVRVEPGGALHLQLQLDAQILDAPICWLTRFSAWTFLRGLGKLPFLVFHTPHSPRS